jgi:hypothetical protein
MEAIVSPKPFLRAGTTSGNGKTSKASNSETRKSDKKELIFSQEVSTMMSIMPARMSERPWSKLIIPLDLINKYNDLYYLVRGLQTEIKNPVHRTGHQTA